MAAATPARAGAKASYATGTVKSRSASWTSDGSRIVTRTVLDTDDGDVELWQLGGSVDGIGMSVFHGPGIAQVGQQVTAEIAEGDVAWVTTMREGRLTAGASITDLPRMEFTHTTTALSGAPLRWKSGCAFISYAEEGTSHIPGDAEFAEIDASVAEWMTQTRQCGYLEIVIDGPERREVGFDRVNLVKFRDSFWGRPARGGSPAETYQPEAGGLTTIFFVDEACKGNDVPPCLDTNPRNGEILDADIELNGVNYALSIDGNTEGTASCQSDVANTVTHELGHLIGLDHTCWVGDGERPVDGNGDPVPSCDSPTLPERITNATMYNFQECGETIKASLESDDVAGFCTVYPLANDPDTCAPVVEKGCCSTVQRPSEARVLVWLVLAAIAVLPLRRRRRARR